MNEESEGAWCDIIELISLCLTLDEHAIEAPVQDRGAEASMLLMNEKFDSIRLLSDDESYQCFWVSNFESELLAYRQLTEVRIVAN